MDIFNATQVLIIFGQIISLIVFFVTMCLTMGEIGHYGTVQFMQIGSGLALVVLIACQHALTTFSKTCSRQKHRDIGDGGTPYESVNTDVV